MEPPGTKKGQATGSVFWLGVCAERSVAMQSRPMKLCGMGMILLLACLNAPWCFASAQDEVAVRELKLFAGTWRPVSAENNGYAAPAADLAEDRWVRDADGNWLMQRDGKILVGWRVKSIDPTKVPREIDVGMAGRGHAANIRVRVR